MKLDVDTAAVEIEKINPSFWDTDKVGRAYLRQLLRNLVDDASLKTGIPAIDELLAECINTLRIKGADYTIGSADKLANFNRGAEFFGTRPAQVLGIYLWKHVAAVFNFIKSDGQSESEPIRGRIVDAINYLLLFWLMVSSEKMDRVPPTASIFAQPAPETTP